MMNEEDPDLLQDDFEEQIKKKEEQPEGFADWQIALLAIVVIVSGAANDVSGKITTVPMGNYSFLMGIFNALVYTVVYLTVLLVRFLMGWVPREQFRSVWGWSPEGSHFLSSIPKIKYFIVMGLMDGVGTLMGLISKPQISGDLIVLLPQTSILFVMIFSMMILKSQYSYWQVWSVMLVLCGVVITLLERVAKVHVSGGLIYIIVMALSPAPSAVSFVLKEMLFGLIPGLDIFIVNSHASMFQLLLQPVFIPLTFLITPNQTLGLPIGEYLEDGFKCFIGITPEHVHDVDCSPMPWPYLIYIACNLAFNISILLLVKRASALMSFMAIKAVLPLSVSLFFINWPLLKATPFNFWVILGLVVILCALVSYRVSSNHQKEYSLGCCSPELPLLAKPPPQGASLIN